MDWIPYVGLGIGAVVLLVAAIGLYVIVVSVWLGKNGQ